MSSLLELIADEPQRPQERLAGHRFDWPLNASTIDIKPPPGSFRKRLMQAIKDLKDSGVMVVGPINGGDDPQPRSAVVVRGSFNRSGQPYEDIKIQAQDELLAQVQQALIAQGLPAVVSMNSRIIVPQVSPASDTELVLREIDAQGISEAELPALLEWLDENHELTCSQAFHLVKSGWTVPRMQPWAELDFDRHEAMHWGRNINDPEEASQWREQGFSPSVAHQWRYAKISLTEAQEWSAAVDRVSPSAIRALLDAGHSRASIKSWMKLLGHYASNPSLLSRFRSQGVTETRAEQMAEAGYNKRTADRALEWLDRTRLPEAEAWEWILLGPDFTVEARRSKWVKLGLTAVQIAEWQQAFGRYDITPLEVEMMLGGEQDPDQLKRWTEQSPELGRENRWRDWQDHDYTPEQAGAWVRAHADWAVRSRVQEWIDSGVEPEEAAEWMRLCDFRSYAQAQKWISVHPRCSDPALVAELVEDRIRPEQAEKVLRLLGGQARPQ